MRAARLLILPLLLVALTNSAPPPLAAALDGVDALLTAGQFRAALAAADALVQRAPRSAPGWARLGMAHAARGETSAASVALGTALGLGLTGRNHDLVRLYQAQLAAQAGHTDEAAQQLATIPPTAALAPLAAALAAAAALRRGTAAEAASQLQTALGAGLPEPWRARALAQLQLLGEPAQTVGWAWHPADPLATPLLPPPLDADALAALGSAPMADLPLRRGELALRAGLPLLAAHFFEQLPMSQQPLALIAYAHWQAGDRETGLRRLEQLAQQQPADARTAALLALAYTAENQPALARQTLDALGDAGGRSPDAQLAWGELLAHGGDYPAAAAAYARALSLAPLADRVTYLLAQAGFHLGTTFEQCEHGLPAAQQAAARAPRDLRAWQLLATAALRCDTPAAAAAAARRALALDPASADATYELGRALSLSGDRSAAREALVRAADLAGDSDLRRRAEAQLALLGVE